MPDQEGVVDDAKNLVQGGTKLVEGASRLAAGDVDPSSVMDTVQGAAQVAKPAAKLAGACCIVEVAMALFIFLFFVGIIGGPGSNNDEASASTAITNGTTTATISKAQLDRIKENKPAYIAAANKYHITWQILAALHSREGSNSQARSGPSGEAPGEVNPDSHKVECETYTECEYARARHLKALAKSVYGVTLTTTSSDTDVQKAFLAYNRGYMYKNGGCKVQDSPYVFNNYDDAHHHMKWPNNSCEPESTRGHVNIPNGAYTVYVYLINKGI